MHPTLEELLAARDGQAESATVAHVAACAACRDEVDRLAAVRDALRALPQLPPRQDLWPAIARSRDEERWQRPLRRVGWAIAAMALVITGVAGARGAIETWREARLARDTRELVAESQRLERVLTAPGGGGGVVRGRTASTIAELEDRIAVVDESLTKATRPSADVVALWQERVRLLDALNSMRTTRDTYVGL
jgi:hypothetical protein